MPNVHSSLDTLISAAPSGNSSNESWWRVGRAKPDTRTGNVEATNRLEVTRARCLAPLHRLEDTKEK